MEKIAEKTPADQTILDRIVEFITSSDFAVTFRNIAIIVAIILVIRHSGKLVITKIIRRTITTDKFASKEDERMRENTLISILNGLLRISLWAFGGMLILAQLKVDIGPLIAGASILGIAIGFGAQAIVKDFVSGLFIILENQYRIGDFVTLAGISGTVEAINIRQTVLRDGNGNKHFIPHSQINTTTNQSIDFSTMSLKIDISYDSNVKKAEKLINQIGQQLAEDKTYRENILEAPKFLRINDFNGHAVTLLINGKVKAGSQWSVAGIMRQKIKEAFETNKIHMPYTHVVLHQESQSRSKPLPPK